MILSKHVSTVYKPQKVIEYLLNLDRQCSERNLTICYSSTISTQLQETEDLSILLC